MSTATKTNNATVVDKCTQRLNALKKYVTSSKTEISINGVAHKATEVLAIYQTCLDTRAALATKRSETKAAMGDRAEAEASRGEADKALKPWVINQFGAGSQQAIDFGFPPPKVPTKSVETKSKAIALGKATRIARNTMGPKKRLGIKGTLAAPTATAPAAPATNVVQAAAPPPVSTPAAVVVAQASPPQVTSAAAPVASAPAPANGAPAPVTNGASH